MQELEKELKDVALDGSTDFQVVGTINTTDCSRTIFARSFEESYDEYAYESGSKLLHIQAAGTLCFTIHDGKQITGNTVVTDGKDHVVALRYLKGQDTWYIFLDGKEEASGKQAPIPDPENSVFRVGVKVGNFERFTGKISNLKYSSDAKQFDTILNIDNDV